MKYIPIKRQYWTEALVKYLLLFAVFSAFNYWVLQHFFTFGQSTLLAGLSAWKECGLWLDARGRKIFRVQPFSVSVFPNWDAICRDFKLASNSDGETAHDQYELADVSRLASDSSLATALSEAEVKKHERVDFTFLRGELGKHEIIYYGGGFHTSVHYSLYGPAKDTFIRLRRVQNGYALELQIGGADKSLVTIPFQEFYLYDVDENEAYSLARKVCVNRETARQEFGWTAVNSYIGEKITHKYCEVYHQKI